MTSFRFSGLFKEHWVLGLVLLFGFIHGAIYVFMIPPWQHYDEPGHFEYAWLIANRWDLPASGDYDQSLRREVAASMLEHDFFRDSGFQPNLLAQTEPVWIGISQINDRPVYYLLVAAPLHLLRNSDVTLQLYVGRLVSLFLYLITIFAAYGITAELASSASPLRWVAPAALVMLPGFTDLMTAVNDDVGATASFSLFLWAGVRLMNLGLSWSRLFFLAATAAVCFWAKNTVTVAAVLVIIPVAFSVLRGPRQSFAWTLLCGGALVGVGVIFIWGEPAGWHGRNYDDTGARISNPDTPLGKYAFQLSVEPDAPLPRLFQVLPIQAVEQLRGQSVTLGAWIWADRDSLVRTPVLVNHAHSNYKEIKVGTRPSFFSINAKIAKDAENVRVLFSPLQNQLEERVKVYYDGLVLLEGEYLSDEPPQFEHVDGRIVVWGDHEYNNLIRNASAERAWPGVRGWVDEIVSEVIPGRPSLIMTTLLDWKTSRTYFYGAFQRIFRTFWAKFGWGNVPLIGHKPYRTLGIFSLLGLAGAGIGLWHRRWGISWPLVLFLGLAIAIIWGLAWMRGSITILEDNTTFIPVARYGYPAIIPVILVLSFGWYELLKICERRLRTPAWILWTGYLGLWLALDIVAVISITRYYSV